jgi:putative ABC transport system ATP-binding protein
LTSPLLQAKNLSHRFDTLLYKGIDLTLNLYESIAIIGKSGSGKSTLLHNLSTLLAPTTGMVEIMERDMYHLSEKALVTLRRNDLGIIFQSHYLFRGFSAQENIDIALRLSDQTFDHDLTKELDIDDHLEKKVTELSGGQQQRVSIARILMKQPRIIFADEPTGNLDQQNANDVMKILLSYVKEKEAGLIMVTHDETLAALCDHCYQLVDQQLLPCH